MNDQCISIHILMFNMKVQYVFMVTVFTFFCRSTILCLYGVVFFLQYPFKKKKNYWLINDESVLGPY